MPKGSEFNGGPGLEPSTCWFVVHYPFAISLICLGSAYLLDQGFRSFSGPIGPKLTVYLKIDVPRYFRVFRT
jgi:hypothetical protein